MKKYGFSWKRFFGITKAKSNLSRKIGIPLTKAGRQRKIGSLITGGGCVIYFFIPILITIGFIIIKALC